MLRSLYYIKALLKRHWASFMFASIIPAIVGLFAVAATTVLDTVIYENYMLEDKYYNITSVGYMDKKEDEISRSFSMRSSVFVCDFGSIYWEKLKKYPIVGKSCSGISGKYPDGTDENFIFIDYAYEQLFPTKLYKGPGFSGTTNEIILDIEHLGRYEIGDILDLNCVGMKYDTKNDSQEFFDFSITATVVGFKRDNEYMRKETACAKVCLLGGLGYHEYSYFETEYITISYNDLNEIFNIQSLIDSAGKRGCTYNVALAHLNADMTDLEFNKHVLVVFLALTLAILAVLIDLCVNGSMLKRTERIAVRSGLKNKDIAIAYIIKALLQLLLSTVIMLGVVLYYNHKSWALLIMESLWGGVVAVLFLSLISWAIDCIRLYRSWRVKI